MLVLSERSPGGGGLAAGGWAPTPVALAVG